MSDSTSFSWMSSVPGSIQRHCIPLVVPESPLDFLIWIFLGFHYPWWLWQFLSCAGQDFCEIFLSLNLSDIFLIFNEHRMVTVQVTAVICHTVWFYEGCILFTTFHCWLNPDHGADGVILRSRLLSYFFLLSILYSFHITSIPCIKRGTCKC